MSDTMLSELEQHIEAGWERWERMPAGPQRDAWAAQLRAFEDVADREVDVRLRKAVGA